MCIRVCCALPLSQRTALFCYSRCLQENNHKSWEETSSQISERKRKQHQNYCKTTNRQVGLSKWSITFSPHVKNNTWGKFSCYCLVATFFNPQLAKGPHGKKTPPSTTLIQPVQPHNKVKMKTAGKHTCLNAVFAYILHQSWDAITTFIFICSFMPSITDTNESNLLFSQPPHSFSLRSRTVLTYISSTYYAMFKHQHK